MSALFTQPTESLRIFQANIERFLASAASSPQSGSKAEQVALSAAILSQIQAALAAQEVAA